MNRRHVLLLAACLAGSACKPAAVPVVQLVTTTTTQDSGLLDRLVPAAEKKLGIHIKVIALGSGEALKRAESGDADIVIAHSPAAELEVVKKGDLIDRSPLMWNRFLIVGPADDPAHVRDSAGDPAEAFRRIRASAKTFVSRGDESGTHKKEQALWKLAGLSADDAQVKKTGQGQGETIQVADQLGAYALVDSSTWQKIHAVHLAVLFDPQSEPSKGAVMTNPYHVMLENAERHAGAHAADAKRLKEWLGTAEAAAIITSGGLFALGAPPGSS